MTDLALQEDVAREASAPSTKQVSKLDAFMASLDKRSDSLGVLLAEAGVDPSRFLAVARRALAKDPNLVACTAASLMQAFINAATDGLLPDGRKGAITWFNDNKSGKRLAQWMPMYQGLLDVAYRSQLFLSIEAQVVYDKEEFEYQLGDTPFIKHKRSAVAVASRKIVAAYAIAKTTNGGVYREVMEKPDLDKVAAVSRAKNGPNKDWPEEMARKAPLRRLWKYLPKTPAMERIAEHDDANYDLTQVHSKPEPPRQLRPGFAPKQIAAPTDDLPSEGASDEALTAGDILDDDDIPDFGPPADAVEVEGGGRAASDGEESPPGDGLPAPTPKTAGLTLKQRLDQFIIRINEATATTKLSGLWANAQGLHAELERADPETAAEMKSTYDARYAEIEDDEKRKAQQ